MASGEELTEDQVARLIVFRARAEAGVGARRARSQPTSTWFRRVVVTFAAVVVVGIAAFAIHSYVALEPRSSFKPGQITRISSASSCVFVIGASVEVCSDQVNAALARVANGGTGGPAAEGDCVIVEINERDPYEVRDVWLTEDVRPTGC